MFKKFTASSLLIGALVLGGGVSVHAEDDISFEDVNKDSFAYDSIMYLAGEGIIKGYGNGKFGLKDDVTRGQVAALIARYLDLDVEAEYDNPYTDVEGDMFEYEILAVSKEGHMQGIGKNRFNPEATLTRVEMAQVLTNVFDLDVKEEYDFKDMSESHWGNDAVRALYSNGITLGTGNGLFKPDDTVTREQYAEFLYRGIHLDEDFEAEPIEPEDNNDDGNNTGGKDEGKDEGKEEEKDEDKDNEKDEKDEKEIVQLQVVTQDEVEVGGELALRLIVVYDDKMEENVTEKATFIVDNKKVIKITDDEMSKTSKVVTGLKEGTATITAKYKGQEESMTVKVVAKEEVEEEEKEEEEIYDPIEVDANYVLDPIVIRGYTYSHDGWAVDSSDNPQYINKNTGNPVKPGWKDEFGLYSQSLPKVGKRKEEPFSISTGVINIITGKANYEKLYRYGQNFIVLDGLPMTREEYETALDKLIETKEAVTFGDNITMYFTEHTADDGSEQITFHITNK